MTLSLASPFLDILACPKDRSPLKASGESLSCTSCGVSYPLSDGIPILFEPAKRHLLFDAGAGAADIGQKVNKANKDFHDLYADHYEDKHAGDIFNPKTQERLKKNVETLYARRQIRSVLDVGCGTGNVLRHLRGDLVAGMDISPRSLALARRFTPNVLAGDANALPFKDGSFDAVTAYSLLHHIVDVEGLFKEVSRVLKIGGIFYTDWDPNRNYGWEKRLRGRILALPGLKQLKPIVKRALGSPQTHVECSDAEKLLSGKREEYELANYHEGKSNPREFNPQAVRAMLERAGFGDIRIFVFDHQPKGGEHRLHPSGGVKDWIYRRFMTMSAKSVR